MTALEPYALALGALVGVYIRARVRGQTGTWSPAAFITNRECVTDAVVAGALAFVWTVPITLELPVIGVVSWPPFQFPPAAGLAQRSVLMGLGAFLFVEILKIVLLRWPTAFAKYAGTTPSRANGTDEEPKDQKEAVLPKRADKPPVEPKTP